MFHPQTRNLKSRATTEHHSVALAKRSRRRLAHFVKRSAHFEDAGEASYAPPEDWYEPTARGGDYRIIVQPPGDGYRHVVNPTDIRERLSRLPAKMLAQLEVVQLSEMTRKKRRFPCYGMQWGATLYLYPAEESLIEYFPRPPKPAQRIEAEMYGGQWEEEKGGNWKLIWSEEAIKDFYLNNILMHELGHLLDTRNTSYIDRERYAEWFAIRYGYKAKCRTNRPSSERGSVRKRHHRK